MSKKDISMILKEGTTKQRLLILAESIARDSFDFQHPDLRENKKPLLTDKEFKALSDSFKTTQEIKQYNKWREYNLTVKNSISNLQGLTFEVKMHYSNLRGYILLWNAIEGAEELANSILHEIRDVKQRKKIAKDIPTDMYFLFAPHTVDPEGYLSLQIKNEDNLYFDERGNPVEGSKQKRTRSKEYSLWEIMNNVKKQATDSIIRFISWKQAILDYMDETGFNVKTYKDMIKVLYEQVNTPIIGWEKYLPEYKNFIPGKPSVRTDKLKHRYNITPVISELKVDKEIYDYYKNKFLADE